MQPRVRSASLTGYPTLSRSLGLDPAALAAAVGLTMADLDGSDRWIPATAASRLLELSAQRSGAADFALRLAELRRLGTLGPLSAVLRDEPDLRGVLALLVRHERVYNEALHLRVDAEGLRVTVRAWLEFGEPVVDGQSLDLVLAALVGIIRMLVRADWEPLSALFAHAAPDDPETYRRLFGPGVQFEQSLTGLVFHRRDLALPVLGSDPSIRPYTHALLPAILPPSATTAAGQVAEALEWLLPLGNGSAEQVSRHLGLQPRQLRRSLAEEGESFSGVVHAVRAALAERFLSAGHYSLTQLSEQLGFAAPSAFSRWFRQRFGISPSEWRTALDEQSSEGPASTRS